MGRKIVFSLGLLILSLAVVKQVKANEGLIKLLPVNESKASCLALSVFREGRYQIGDWDRLAEIEEGKFGVNSDERFDRLMISAEQDWNPRKPSERVVAQGTVEALALGTVEVGESPKAVVTPTPTVTKVKAVEAVKGSGSVLGAIAKAVVTVVLILIGVGVVLGVITKRKGF